MLDGLTRTSLALQPFRVLKPEMAQHNSRDDKMKVSIIGTGYVGLVTGACLAEKGHYTICVDVDQEKVDRINNSIPSIYEKGLEELLKKNIHKRLEATTDLNRAIIETEITLIAVGTPFDGNHIDLTSIREVSWQIGESLQNKLTYHLVAVKSTVVPGTTDQIVLPILEAASGKKAGIDFGVGMNPEFLTEGEAIQDFMCPDRIVLGGIDEKSLQVLEQLYSVFEGVEQVRTNNKTAEMIKYTSNALLATMISFSNEIGNLCATMRGSDVVDVMRGLHLSRYLSPAMPNGDRIVAPISAFLWAGCGFGGSCLPKDVRTLIAHGEEAGRPLRLLDAVMRINAEQHLEIFSLLNKHFPCLKGIRVTVLGVAFRPDTNDMRESPALPIIQGLLAREAQVKVYDPVAKPEIEKTFERDAIMICGSLAEAIEDTQAIILATAWQEFKQVPALLRHLDPQPVFIDGRRMLDKSSIARYQGIGL
jgi:UDPglucose 6-dehydrogenase/GDP-mannose 6-dehydrogenase